MKNNSTPPTLERTSKLVEKPQKKLSPREQYLLERDRIKFEIGDLQQIRLKIGLSQRRLCQLLLVDPSAWTRWNKLGAPPHVYQALRWLLELKKINPDAVAPINIESRVDFIQSTTQSKIKELENSIALLERTVNLSPTIQPATNDSTIERALREQHAHFAQELSVLKAQIALLAVARTTRSQKKRVKKHPKKRKKRDPLKLRKIKKESKRRKRAAQARKIKRKK